MIETIAARGKADRELSTTVVLIMYLEPGTPFSKIPVTFSVRKAAFFSFAVFAFRIKVTMIWRMIQWNYQLTKQNWPVYDLGTVLLVNRISFYYLNCQARNALSYIRDK